MWNYWDYHDVDEEPTHSTYDDEASDYRREQQCMSGHMEFICTSCGGVTAAYYSNYQDIMFEIPRVKGIFVNCKHCGGLIDAWRNGKKVFD